MAEAGMHIKKYTKCPLLFYWRYFLVYFLIRILS
jgi:hypothetical protein